MDEAATASRSNKVDERSVEVEVLFVKLAERNAIFVSSAPSSGLAVVCTASSRAKSVACKNARRCVSLLVEGTSFVVSLIITTDRSAVAFQANNNSLSLSCLAAPLFQPASPQGQPIFLLRSRRQGELGLRCLFCAFSASQTSTAMPARQSFSRYFLGVPG